VKLKDDPMWNKVILKDRTILRKDLPLLSTFQVEMLLELEVVRIGDRAYKAVTERSK
jgi:hypothetical protein